MKYKYADKNLPSPEMQLVRYRDLFVEKSCLDDIPLLTETSHILLPKAVRVDETRHTKQACGLQRVMRKPCKHCMIMANSGLPGAQIWQLSLKPSS